MNIKDSSDIESLKKELTESEKLLSDANGKVEEEEKKRNEIEERRNLLKSRIEYLESERCVVRGLGDGELLASVRSFANGIRHERPFNDKDDWAAFDELFERYAVLRCPRFASAGRRGDELGIFDESESKAVIFARGERNLWGFVRIEDNGDYLFGSWPNSAKLYDSVKSAEDAIIRMIAYDQKRGAKSPTFTVMLTVPFKKG